MLDYIRKELNVEETAVQESDSSLLDTDNSFLVECAHLFQELDDVSEEGTVESIEGRGRIGSVEIPLEADMDIEPDIIEMNLADGCRVTDVPKDAGKNTIETESAQMKTYDDFFTEAYENSIRFERESEENHVSRIRRKANQLYNEYVEHCYQEGLFGFGEMDINDTRVPGYIAFDFGSACGTGSMMVQVPIKYKTTDRHGKRKITKLQYECATLLMSNPNLMNAIIDDFVQNLKQTLGAEIGNAALNQVVMIQFIGIPEQVSNDEYKIYVASNTSIPGKPEFDMVYAITKPGKQSSNITAFPGAAPSTTDAGYTFTLMKPTAEDDLGIKSLNTKMECVQLEYEVNRPRRFEDSFYQEAIDFEEGESDEGENNDSSNEGESQSEEPKDDEKKNVDTNDVSDAIVEKVSSDDKDGADDENNDDEGESSDGDEGATIGDEGEESTDEGEGEESDDSSVDEELENLDSSLEDSGEEGDEDLGGTEGDTSSMDIENMSISELINLGENKLKDMTPEQLKAFVSGNNAETGSDEGESSEPEDTSGLPSSENPDDDNPDAGSDDIEVEAFVLTPKNVNKELDVNIRNCLGILNDSEISSSEIFSKFKKAGKKLNKVSAKASNMSKVYTDSERKTIGDMNKALVNLTLELKANAEVASVKEKMKAFVNLAAAVGKIVESKKN